MKRSILGELRHDLWVVALDVIAVNLSYILALLTRYFVHNNFRNAANAYLEVCLKFAPYYTVLCVVVFALYGLYNGMWRYAGLRHMNRILGASVTTAALYVLGTAVFFQRIPRSVYALGAAYQFLLIAVIRFSYRFITVETQRIRNRNLPTRNVMIVGADVSAEKAIKYLENEPLFRSVVVVDGKRASKARGKTFLGLPVVEDAAAAIAQYDIRCIIIADPLLSDAARENLRKLSDGKDIELHDYTGFLRNESGVLPLTDLLRVTEGPVVLRIGDRQYDSVEQAMQAMNGRYVVKSIRSDGLTIEVQQEKTDSPDEEWARKYKEVTGEDVSFF